jgi:hypothetical protein
MRFQPRRLALIAYSHLWNVIARYPIELHDSGRWRYAKAKEFGGERLITKPNSVCLLNKRATPNKTSACLKPLPSTFCVPFHLPLPST